MRIRSLLLVPAVSLAALALAGCASAPRQKTGDIAFRLHWLGEDDLDLHVVEPGGIEINFIQRKAKSGGELDVDCNSAPDRICKQPVENVYWPVGRAPEGSYTYWVELFQDQHIPKPVPFTLDVLLGSTVIHSEKGFVGPGAAKFSDRFLYRFERAQPTVRSTERSRLLGAPAGIAPAILSKPV